jgi:hypothetical protein
MSGVWRATVRVSKVLGKAVYAHESGGDHLVQTAGFEFLYAGETATVAPVV